MVESVRTRGLFATPLVVGTIDDPQMNADLEKAILARRAEHAGVRLDRELREMERGSVTPLSSAAE